MESRTDDLAARLLRCPVGCAFLLTIVRDEVPIEIAVTPPQAFARAAIALNALNPWSADFERAVTAALSRGADLASLARAVVDTSAKPLVDCSYGPDTAGAREGRHAVPKLLPLGTASPHLGAHTSQIQANLLPRGVAQASFPLGGLRATSQGRAHHFHAQRRVCVPRHCDRVGRWRLGNGRDAPQIRSRDRRNGPHL